MSKKVTKPVNMAEKVGKRSVEELYEGIFAIRDSLQEIIQQANEVATIATDFGGEIARVITLQINKYFIPGIAKYLDNETTPGAVNPLITFLDSVPLAMTRIEPEPTKVAPAPIQANVATPPGTNEEVPATPAPQVGATQQSSAVIPEKVKMPSKQIVQEKFKLFSERYGVRNAAKMLIQEYPRLTYKTLSKALHGLYSEKELQGK